jgi:D-sedoheptulose 7-phosphate isomerase
MNNFSSQEQPLSLLSEDAQLDLERHRISATNVMHKHCARLTEAIDRLAYQLPNVARTAFLLAQVLHHGGKVLVAGNGGSAVQAQHFAAELVGRFKREHDPYPVMAITSDAAILTAVANDYGYQYVFARQIQAFGQAGDILIIFSTSGESENLISAASAARYRKMSIIAILGESRCRMENLADVVVQVPAMETATIQELHMLVAHVLCDLIEARFVGEEIDKWGPDSRER